MPTWPGLFKERHYMIHLSHSPNILLGTDFFSFFFITVLFILLLIYKAFLSTQKMVELVKPFLFVNRRNCIRFFLFCMALVSSVTIVFWSVCLLCRKCSVFFFLFRIVENMAACKQWHLSVSRQTGSAARTVFDIMLS